MKLAGFWFPRHNSNNVSIFQWLSNSLPLVQFAGLCHQLTNAKTEGHLNLWFPSVNSTLDTVLDILGVNHDTFTKHNLHNYIYTQYYKYIHVYVCTYINHKKYQNQISCRSWNWNTGHFLGPSWVLPVTVRIFFCSIAYFWFLIVRCCSDPLTTPGSDILAQSPQENFQNNMEQIGSVDRLPKSGFPNNCHISHQIWMYINDIILV